MLISGLCCQLYVARDREGLHDLRCSIIITEAKLDRGLYIIRVGASNQSLFRAWRSLGMIHKL